MNRLFHECYSDPALGALLAGAFILVLVMGWFVLKGKLKKRQKARRRERRRVQSMEKRAEPLHAAEGPK